MQSHRRPSKRFPKISTLPRRQTEAAYYLDMYKLTVEKKRLQQELHSLEEQCQQIRQRLGEIEGQTAELEYGAQQLRDRDDSATPAAPTSNVYLPHRGTGSPAVSATASSLDDYSTLFLEY